MGIKKKLCDLIDEENRGYVKVWEVVLYSILLFVCVGMVILVFTLTGHIISGIYFNGLEWVFTEGEQGIINTITITKTVIGFIFWCVFIVVGDLVNKILTFKIISCPVDKDDTENEGSVS